MPSLTAGHWGYDGRQKLNNSILYCNDLARSLERLTAICSGDDVTLLQSTGVATHTCACLLSTGAVQCMGGRRSVAPIVMCDNVWSLVFACCDEMWTGVCGATICFAVPLEVGIFCCRWFRLQSTRAWKSAKNYTYMDEAKQFATKSCEVLVFLRLIVFELRNW